MSVNQRLVNPLTDNLFDIILKLETREECYEFFEDLCTIHELHDMSQRLEVARMLRHGEKYDKIEEATGEIFQKCAIPDLRLMIYVGSYLRK